MDRRIPPKELGETMSALTDQIAYGLGMEDGTRDRDMGFPLKTRDEMAILYSWNYIKGYYAGYGN
jgi:hypothetical protein